MKLKQYQIKKDKFDYFFPKKSFKLARSLLFLQMINSCMKEEKELQTEKKRRKKRRVEVWKLALLTPFSTSPTASTALGFDIGIVWDQNK